MDRAHHGTAYHGGEHYENFPVGSWLLPARMRPAVLALYRFARTGDDLADEGALTRDARLAGLQALRAGLLAQAPQGHSEHLFEIGAALRRALDGHGLSTAAADRMLSAFEQDAYNAPMATETAVLEYCHRSANPIGELFLQLSGLHRHAAYATLLKASDDICTGLQLANFAQDMGEDVARDRHYVPDDWFHAAGITTRDALARLRPAQLPVRMARWAWEHLHRGACLPAQMRRTHVPDARRLAIEVALCLEGGLAIADKVRQDPAGVWHQSPTISRHQLPMLLLRSLRRAFSTPPVHNVS